MIGWKSTKNALGKLEDLLTCKICGNLVSDPCTLEACDHSFCRGCVEKLVGADSKCPECGSFAWVKDLKTNRQLVITVNMCLKLRSLVGSADHDISDDKTSATTEWEETQQTCDLEIDTYQFPSPEAVESETVRDCTYDEKNGVGKLDTVQQEIQEATKNLESAASNVFRKGLKTYSRIGIKKRLEDKKAGSRADNDEEEQQDEHVTDEAGDEKGGNDLFYKNGKQRSSLNAKENEGNESTEGAVLDNSKVAKRKQVKEKCFGKQSKKKRSDKNVHTLSAVDGNKLSVDQQPSENVDENLQFENKTDESWNYENVDGSSFTRLRSRSSGECVDGSLMTTSTTGHCNLGTSAAVKGTPKTRAQKRKCNGTQVHSSSESIKPYLEQTRCADAGKGMSNVEETENSTKTPIKQGVNKQKIQSPTNSVSSPLNVKRNKRGETPLHVAAIKGNTDTVRTLLKEGADPNTKDHAGWTPLHEACNHGYMTIAELLLDHGAMIDIPGGFDHDSPLHDAVANGRVEIASLLVSRGASLDVRNKQGLIPKDFAVTEEMMSILSSSPSNSDNVPSQKKAALLVQSLSATTKVLLATGLGTEQKVNLQKCAAILSASIVNEFSISVTHIVTATNDKGVCPRTLKYLKGVLTGKWIVDYGWISKSLRRKTWVEETPFEVKGTSDATVEAPKRARINSLQQLPGLFDGCQFYFFGEFVPPHPSKEDLLQMIDYSGGKILSREPKPDVDESLRLPNDVTMATALSAPLATVAYHACPDSKQYRCTRYVVYDPLAEKKPRNWQTDTVCSVPSTWLMDCASNFKIIDLQ